VTGIVLQVNVSSGGIPKRQIAVGELTPSGITGDSWRYAFHGGPKQAVLLITLEGIAELVAQGFPLYPGALGENLTTQGIDRRGLRFGQHLRVGSATIELTKMRQPCATLNPYGAGIQAAMYDARVAKGDAGSPLWGLSGFYAKVVKPGTVVPGDHITPVT
jgi:MOSC domain-containing protein YiiM